MVGEKNIDPSISGQIGRFFRMCERMPIVGCVFSKLNIVTLKASAHTARTFIRSKTWKFFDECLFREAKRKRSDTDSVFTTCTI